MAVSDHRLGAQLLGLENCPHYGVASPLFKRVWASDEQTQRTDGGQRRRRAAFVCTTCGAVVSAEGNPGENVSNPRVLAIYPITWEPDSRAPCGRDLWRRAHGFPEIAHRVLIERQG